MSDLSKNTHSSSQYPCGSALRGAGKHGSVSADIASNLPPVNQQFDSVRSLKGKRQRRRPVRLAKDGPDVQQAYIPCAGLVVGTKTLISGEHRKNVHCDDLNNEVSDNNCYDATVKSFRDAAYLSKGARQSRVKRFHRKLPDAHK